MVPTPRRMDLLEYGPPTDCTRIVHASIGLPICAIIKWRGIHAQPLVHASRGYPDCEPLLVNRGALRVGDAEAARHCRTSRRGHLPGHGHVGAVWRRPGVEW